MLVDAEFRNGRHIYLWQHPYVNEGSTPCIGAIKSGPQRGFSFICIAVLSLFTLWAIDKVGAKLFTTAKKKEGGE